MKLFTMIKICNKCKIEKELIYFSKDKTKKDGFYTICKECVKNAHKDNSIKISLYMKEYRIKNKDSIKLYKKQRRKKDKTAQYNRRKFRLKTDLNFKLKAYLRSRIRSAIKNNQKSGSAVFDLGCSTEQLKNYLESKFQPGMTWENWSYKGWHIDHIKPLAVFDLTDSKQFKQACHYTNLQPLWWQENLNKSDNIIYGK